MARFLAILAILTIISGCATCPDYAPIGSEPRPDFRGLTQEQWNSIPVGAQEIITYNDLAAKQYIRDTEARARAYDEAFSRRP